MKKNKRFIAPMLSIIVAIVGILGGYMIGSRIATTKFVVDKYANLNADELFDDISKIDYQGKTPDQFTAAEVFQISSKSQTEYNYYKNIGVGDLETSLGVSQSTYTLDEKNGNTIHIAFVSASSYIKVAQQSTFEIGGNVAMQHGDTKDGIYENVVWNNKYDEYTWEGYKEKFGKYANSNSSYIVSSKTVLSQKFDGKNGNLYNFSIELDPILGTVTYAQQISANLGIEPSAINFKKITLTFTVDDQFRMLIQDKVEEYSVPMFGMNIELTGRIHNESVYE
jgi:hypothetical protein